MYEPGNLLVCENVGVCRVTEIRSRRTDGVQCYVLSPLYENCTMLVPTDSDKVYMRPILTKAQALELIDRMPVVSAAPISCKSIQQLTEKYKAALESKDADALVVMTKSIYAKKTAAAAQKRQLGSVDERFLRRGEELLFGELAAALQITVDEVLPYIQQRLEHITPNEKQ